MLVSVLLSELTNTPYSPVLALSCKYGEDTFGWDMLNGFRRLISLALYFRPSLVNNQPFLGTFDGTGWVLFRR